MSATLTAQRSRIARSSYVDPTRKERFRSVLVIGWLLLAGTGCVVGLDYYLTPLAGRPLRPDQALYSPSGTLGKWYGAVGLALAVLGVVLYSIRKRTGLFREVGTLRSWLYLHIFLCSLGAMLLLLHTGFTWSGSGGAVSGAVVLALISGGYGRLLYQRIPKTPHGRFLTPDEMKEERVRLAEEVCRVAACSPAQADIWLGQPIRTDHPSPLRAMALSLWYRLRRQSQASRLSTMLSDAGLKRGRNRELVRLLLADQRLQTQMAMRSPFARMFKRWHWVHVRLVILVGALALFQVLQAWSVFA